MTDAPAIRLARPTVSDAELAAVARVFASRHLAQGPEVAALESEVSELLEGRRVVAVSSGGAALLAALRVAGAGPGDEVIVPAFTFPAAAQAALFLGATPVPADVDPDTLGVCPATVAPRLTHRTRVVVVAHAFGIPADVEGVANLLDGSGVALVEDAACSIGGRTPRGRPSGSVGRFGCFSLHPRKLATCGEGGLIACGPEDEAALRALRDYGRTGSGFGDVFGGAGLNLRLSDVAAAIARVQVGGLAASIARRTALVADYVRRLERVAVPAGATAPGCTCQSMIAVADGDAEAIVRRLRGRGIEAAPAAYDLCGQAFYRDLVAAVPDCPESGRLARSSFALPLHDALGDDDVRRVAEEVALAAPCGLDDRAMRD
jgi:dTDP-4-amino-4,6-dideoxygalactose transaminase